MWWLVGLGGYRCLGKKKMLCLGRVECSYVIGRGDVKVV